MGMVIKEWVVIYCKYYVKVEMVEDLYSLMIYGIKKVFWDGVLLYCDVCDNK